jgi:PhnB protein
MPLHPYLFFSGAGTTRAAMTRYQEILGGRLEILGSDAMPPGENPPFEVSPDFVMHAALALDDGALLMASDDLTGDGAGVKGAALNVDVADEAEARRIFDALSEGGRVDMPLEATFWSPLFGSCVDRFGVAWMVGVGAEGPG